MNNQAKNRITHPYIFTETLRLELDITREYLLKAEDSVETGQFTKAEAMTVHAITHLKTLLRELNERNDQRVPPSKWIL